MPDFIPLEIGLALAALASLAVLWLESRPQTPKEDKP